MSYIALSRKYRPQTFDEIIYQDHIVTTLKNAIELNRISHAYLFTGPRGIGKTSTARIFAKALNCLEPDGVNPCNKCDNCREITTGTSLDVSEIDGASNRGIDEIRQLREEVKFLPSRSKYKIYIIDEVHMLTEAAFNALLKTLEEPPEYVVFIFATTDAHRIPATILSRCQRFSFSKIPYEEMYKHTSNILLKEQIDFEDDALNLIIRNSDGCMRDCLSLIDQIIAYTNGKLTYNDTKFLLGLSEDNLINELYAAIIKKSENEIEKLLYEINLKGLDYKYVVEKFLQYTKILIAMHTFSFKTTKELTADEIDYFTALKNLINVDVLFAIYQTLLKCYNDLKYFTFHSDIFEITVFKLLNIDKVIPVGTLNLTTSRQITKKKENVDDTINTSLDENDKTWQGFVDFVYKIKPAIASNLGYGYLISMDGSQLTIGFNEEKKFSYNVIMKSDNLLFVEKCAKKYFNVDKITVILENGSKKKGLIEKVNKIETYREKLLKKELKEDKGVNLLLKEFEGEILEINPKKDGGK